MDETTSVDTEVQATEVTELATQAVESETAASDPGTVEGETLAILDYTPVIYEVGNGLASTMIWCTFLIVGVLIAFKILEVKR